MLPIVLVLALSSCDQTPTTLDQEAFLDQTPTPVFAMAINAFEFDYLTQTFFFTIAATSPEDSLQVQADLIVSGNILSQLVLNDQGLNNDIQLGDGNLEGNWTLPDSLSSYVDSLWTLAVTASSGSATRVDSVTLHPNRPQRPVIGLITHADTLTLVNDQLVLDTLSVQVTHPQGLDEIRDVTMLSLKPNGEYANHGQPIPLYDDGGQVVFFTFQGVDFTSGDHIAGDGTYSLLLALPPDALSGLYHWTFNAHSWLGATATMVEDSLRVLAPPGLRPAPANLLGVFQ